MTRFKHYQVTVDADGGPYIDYYKSTKKFEEVYLAILRQQGYLEDDETWETCENIIEFEVRSDFGYFEYEDNRGNADFIRIARNSAPTMALTI
jgi:hypothetical protein